MVGNLHQANGAGIMTAKLKHAEAEETHYGEDEHRGFFWKGAHIHCCDECADALVDRVSFPPCGECETHPCERGLRDSEHQRKIRKIQAIIRYMTRIPTPKDTYSLIHMRLIECRDNTKLMAHRRHPQNRVKWRVSHVHEGSKNHTH